MRGDHHSNLKAGLQLGLQCLYKHVLQWCMLPAFLSATNSIVAQASQLRTHRNSAQVKVRTKYSAWYALTSHVGLLKTLVIASSAWNIQNA
jgi:hypothetical protein